MTRFAPSRFYAANCRDVPDTDEWLTAAESERIASFRFTKRRSETRLSRWTAKHAIARALGFPASTPTDLQAITIRNAPDGAPEASVCGRPAPVAISMTDRADWSTAFVSDPSLSIGCDLELVEPRTSTFVDDYLTGAERAVVRADGNDHDLLANTIWSAKESALKVLRTGLRRDTRSVEVSLSPEIPGEWASLDVRSVEGQVFPGWWRRFDEFVLTFACTAPLPPPVSLVDPSPLLTATPSHAWMNQPVHPVGGTR